MAIRRLWLLPVLEAFPPVVWPVVLHPLGTVAQREAPQ